MSDDPNIPAESTPSSDAPNSADPISAPQEFGSPPGVTPDPALQTPAEAAGIELIPAAKAPFFPIATTLRPRGLIAIVLSVLGAMVLMGKEGQWRYGVPAGIVLVSILTFGLLDLAGTFDDVGAPSATVHASKLVGPLGAFLLTSALFIGGLVGGLRGVGPQLVWGGVVTIGFVGMLASIFILGSALGLWPLDELGQSRPLLRRHGFWVLVIGALLYFPFMGSFSLWDPWETHYGEVAREILARDDWVSLWWAQDGWFFSKPILNFWMQAVAMASLGVGYLPDQMLAGANGHLAHPEWIVRAPNVLLTLIALYFIYKGVAKVYGRRAAFFGAVVLATMPDWYFLAHQTMADMPCVASMTAAMGLTLLGLHTSPDERARTFDVKFGSVNFRISAFHLVMGTILICALPQALYLITRNVGFVWGSVGHGFQPHYDAFRSGSGGGNCGLPGNEACAPQIPASVPRALANPASLMMHLKRIIVSFEPGAQGLLWGVLAIALLFINAGERRMKRLYYLAAWFFAALGFMGKGPLGVLPFICASAYLAIKWTQSRLAATKDESEFEHLEFISGLLIVATVAAPWFVAMFVRHGTPFTDRLFYHDMINRAFTHVHDTNEGDDTGFKYFIWQLGYALFPWTALAPLGLTYWMRRGSSASTGALSNRARNDASIFLVLWFVICFGLFTYMGTKFHHYIFPAIPPIAMLIGIALSGMMPRSNFFGDDVDAVEKDGSPSEHYDSLIIGTFAVTGAALLILIGRDLIIKSDADGPGAIRFLQLFTYNYKRPWPEQFDYTRVLFLFTAGGTVLLIGMAVRLFRSIAAQLFLFLGIGLALWGLDVYMVQLAPHWGQRELAEAYYTHRENAEEPFVAYQMNWKGENFYTSNRVPAFVSSGPTFTKWVADQKSKGIKAIYVVTEQSRIGGLRSEAKAVSYEEITDKKLCNKFVVVKVTL